MFVQGIGSSSTCPDSPDFVKRVSWLKNALQSRIPALTDGTFEYYAYRSPYTGANRCTRTNLPSYSNLDSCWSIDDTYQPFFSRPLPVPGGGEASRLAKYVRGYLTSNPVTQLTIVTHSQGGVIATYMVKHYLSPRDARRVTIVSLDSPLRGINSIAPGILRSLNGCANNDLRLDSSFDMTPNSSVIGEINNNRRTQSKLYTVDAAPGCQELPFNRCTSFPLIDDFHSTTGWASGHISVAAETHGDVWNGCFVEVSTTVECASQSGQQLPVDALRIARLTSCAIAQLANDCVAYANDY